MFTRRRALAFLGAAEIGVAGNTSDFFGGCGNGSTILFGGNCCFGVFLCDPDDRG